MCFLQRPTVDRICGPAAMARIFHCVVEASCSAFLAEQVISMVCDKVSGNLQIQKTAIKYAS